MKGVHLRLIRRCIPTVVASIVLSGCGGSSSGNNGQDAPSPDGAMLRGHVADVGTGYDVDAVQVAAASRLTETGSDGRYQLEALTPGTNVMVRFVKQGYAPQYRTLYTIPAAGAVLDVPMAPVVHQESFEQVGEVVLDPAGAARFVLPEGSVLAREDGGVPEWVHASFAPLASGPHPAVMPGNYRGRDNAGVVRPLESFGGLYVYFEDAEGHPLQHIQGPPATLSIPVSSARQDALPETVSLLYFDIGSGLWRIAGQAALEGEPPLQAYVGEVAHAGFWQAGDLYGSVNVRGCVRDLWGEMLPGEVFVRADGVGYAGSSQVSTDSRGRFAVPVRPGETAAITAFAYRTDIWQTVVSAPVEVLAANGDLVLDDCLTLDLETLPPQARIRLQPEALAFDAVLLGETGEATVTIESVGRVTLGIDSHAIVGVDAGLFTLQSDTCSGAQLAPGESCALTLRFAPDRQGAADAMLAVFSTDPEGVARVPLVGEGHVLPTPQLTFSATTLDFGIVPPGDTRQRLLVIGNTGTAPFTVTGLGVSGDAAAFQTDEACLDEEVAPGTSCVLAVDFSPLTLEEAVAFLSVTTDDPDQALPGVDLLGQGGHLDPDALPPLAPIPLAHFVSTDDAALVLAFASRFLEEWDSDPDLPDVGDQEAGARALGIMPRSMQVEPCLISGERRLLPVETRDVGSPFTPVAMAVQGTHWEACDQGVHLGEYFIDGYEENSNLQTAGGSVDYWREGVSLDEPLMRVYEEGFIHKTMSIMHSEWRDDGTGETYTYALEVSGTEDDYMLYQLGSSSAPADMFQEQFAPWPGEPTQHAWDFTGDWGLLWPLAAGPDCPMGRVNLSTLEPMRVTGDLDDMLVLAGKIAASAGGSTATAELEDDQLLVSLNGSVPVPYSRADIQLLATTLCFAAPEAP